MLSFFQHDLHILDFFSVKMYNFSFRHCQGCQGEIKDQNVSVLNGVVICIEGFEMIL